MAKQTQAEPKEPENKEPAPVAAPKISGVTFWPRMRFYSDGPPIYYDRIEDVPPARRPFVETSEAVFLGIEYPRGTGRKLSINGALCIEDREIALHLIAKGKAHPVGTKGKSGALLFDPADLVASGFCSTEQAEALVKHKAHPDADELGFSPKPEPPPPDYNMLSESDIDKRARDLKVHLLVDYEPDWPKYRKEAAMRAYHAKKAAAYDASQKAKG